MTDEKPIEHKEEIHKAYMDPPIIDLEKIKSKMLDESKSLSNKQRYGFFSIIHSSHIGDEYYSIKHKAEKDSNGKIKVAPRGIYAKATRKGKFLDSYFDSTFLREDKKIRERMSEIAKLEHDERLKRVKVSKEKAKESFKKAFKPAGPQEYKDSIYPDNMDYKIPLYKQTDKQKNIDFKERIVFNERRGVLTSPMKHGAFSLKGVLFSYQIPSKKEVEMYKSMTEHEIKEDLERRKNMRLMALDKSRGFKKPFIPNNVNKCDTFQDDYELYALSEDMRKKINEDYERKKKSLEKVDKRFAKHDKAFKPASLSKIVSVI